MSRNKDEVELTLGIPEDKKQVVFDLPGDEPRPWDMNTKLHVAGRRHIRQEAVEKVTGAAVYSRDRHLPGLLVAGFVRSPHTAARVEKVDLSAALAVPGVHGAIDLKRRNILYGEAPLAAVAAETHRALEEGLRKVKVTFSEVRPHAARFEQALEPDAPQVSENRPNVRPLEPSDKAEAVAGALQEADAVVEATCTTQVQTHSSLETHGLVAHWDTDDHLTLWASTQSTFGVRRLARALGLKQSQVTVICEYMGGGFGSKFSAGYMGLAAARLAKQTGRPVKLFLTRHEEHIDTGNRPNSWQKMTLGVSKDGKLGPYRIDVRSTGGISGGRAPRNPMIYDWDRGLVDRRFGDVLTNAGPAAAFRAPGHPEGSFAMETIMDLAAEAIGMDPLAFRMRNDSNPVRAVQFKKGARMIGWKERRPNGAAKGRFRRGLGVASATWGVQGGPVAEALVRIHRDGSVEVRSGVQDVGTGTRTLIALVVAEELALDPASVKAYVGNTNDPRGPGSGGSVTGPSMAPAARQGAFLAGRKLRRLVARHLGCEPEELVFRDGRVVHVSDAKKALSFRDACRLIQGDEISEVGKRKRNWRRAMYRGSVAGCQFAEVEVDTWFGIVRVKRIVAMQDAGVIVNKSAAESQVFGAVIQGISYALLEERCLDRHKGLMLNADLEMYKILGPADMPRIDVVMDDVYNGGSNAPVCALGEPPTIPTSAAIAGAVHNALGVRVTDLPMTPDKVLRALGGEDGR